MCSCQNLSGCHEILRHTTLFISWKMVKGFKIREQITVDLLSGVCSFVYNTLLGCFCRILTLSSSLTKLLYHCIFCTIDDKSNYFIHWNTTEFCLVKMQVSLWLTSVATASFLCIKQTKFSLSGCPLWYLFEFSFHMLLFSLFTVD